jgi:ferredoxin
VSYQLTFDASRCDGYGMCTLIFPERISLDPWGFAHVDPDPVEDRATRSRAHRAVRCCPRAALTLIELTDSEGAEYAHEPGDQT